MARNTLIGLCCCLLSGVAQGEDLLAAYERALENDPSIREADANRLAAREARPQAIAGLLPQITGRASKDWDETEGVRTFAQEIRNPGPQLGQILLQETSGTSEPETDFWTLELRQSVFRWENWVALRRASKEVAQAEADYAAAEQDLLLRVSERYFDVLAARDTLVAQQAALEAVSRQLEQAEKRFEVGLIAITDVEEARAERDSGAAAVIASKRALASAEEALREITNTRFATLERPGDTLPLRGPDPDDEEEWVNRAMEQNLALISSRLAADIARDDVRTAVGGHLPSVDLVASRSDTEVDSTQTFPADPTVSRPNPVTVPVPSESVTDSISLQLNVPIFAGGGTQSRVRASEYRWQAARERFTRVTRQTERQTRDAYLGITSEISRVQALKQALESSRTALKATEAGYEVGTRTAVDVLASRRTLVQSETNYARAKYDYLLNLMRLRQAAGILDRPTLEQINGWLDETVSTTP
jgi:outer membrane protein